MVFLCLYLGGMYDVDGRVYGEVCSKSLCSEETLFSSGKSVTVPLSFCQREMEVILD